MCSPTRHILPCSVVKAREGNYCCFFNEGIQEFLKKCFILFLCWTCRVFVCLAKVDIWNKLEPRIWKDLLFMRTDTPKEKQFYLFHETKKGSNFKEFGMASYWNLSVFVFYFNDVFSKLFFLTYDPLLSWNWRNRRYRKSRKMHLNLSKSRATWGGRSRKQQKHQTPRARACLDFQLCCRERLLQIVSHLPLKRQNNSISWHLLKMRFLIPGTCGLKRQYCKQIDLPNTALRSMDKECLCQFSVMDQADMLSQRF